MDNNNNLPSTISGDGRKFISLLKNNGKTIECYDELPYTGGIS